MPTLLYENRLAYGGTKAFKWYLADIYVGGTLTIYKSEDYPMGKRIILTYKRRPKDDYAIPVIAEPLTAGRAEALPDGRIKFLTPKFDGKTYYINPNGTLTASDL